jgi:hypothetical protein
MFSLSALMSLTGPAPGVSGGGPPFAQACQLG